MQVSDYRAALIQAYGRDAVKVFDAAISNLSPEEQKVTEKVIGVYRMAFIAEPFFSQYKTNIMRLQERLGDNHLVNKLLEKSEIEKQYSDYLAENGAQVNTQFAEHDLTIRAHMSFRAMSKLAHQTSSTLSFGMGVTAATYRKALIEKDHDLANTFDEAVEYALLHPGVSDGLILQKYQRAFVKNHQILAIKGILENHKIDTLNGLDFFAATQARAEKVFAIHHNEIQKRARVNYVMTFFAAVGSFFSQFGQLLGSIIGNNKSRDRSGPNVVDVF